MGPDVFGNKVMILCEHNLYKGEVIFYIFPSVKNFIHPGTS